MNEASEQLGLFSTEDHFPIPDPSRIQEVEQLALKAVKEQGLKVKTVKWKKNRLVMASVGKNGVLNIHQIYQRAEESDLLDLATVMSGNAKPKDMERFQKYIERNMPKEIVNGKSRLVINPARGLFHNLEDTFARIFPLLDNPIDPLPKLGWSPARVGRSGITWGTHREMPEGPLILVNAILDAPDIPNFVVEHILWHEICHQVAPPEKGSGNKRIIHNREFKKLERRYPRLEIAERWEKENVGRLIRRHRGLEE